MAWLFGNSRAFALILIFDQDRCLLLASTSINRPDRRMPGFDNIIESRLRIVPRFRGAGLYLWGSLKKQISWTKTPQRFC
jgi:hypothetical protein